MNIKSVFLSVLLTMGLVLFFSCAQATDPSTDANDSTEEVTRYWEPN